MRKILICVILLCFLMSCKNKNSVDVIEETSINNQITNYILNNQISELRNIINSNNINIHDSEGLTPLLVASQEHNYEILMFLISSDANVNKTGALQYEDMTPLIFALKPNINNEKDIYNIVELLLTNNANPNVRSSNNQTPLSLSIQKNLNSVTVLLLKYDANVNMLFGYGETPLTEALRSNNFEIAHILINYGADINYYNNQIGDNDSILILCVKWGYIDTIKYLVDNGVDLDYKNLREKTALDIAIDIENKEIIKILQE